MKDGRVYLTGLTQVAQRAGGAVPRHAIIAHQTKHILTSGRFSC